MRTRVTASSLLAAALMARPPAAQERMWERGMHPMWWMWGAGGLLMLMMLVFWGVIIACVVIGVRWLVSQGHQDRGNRAFEILHERYARGEIDREELDAKSRYLGGRRT